MKYFLCLIVLVGCNSTPSKPLKYKEGDVVLTKLGETALITSIHENMWPERPYTLDIKDSSDHVQYSEDFIVKVIKE